MNKLITIINVIRNIIGLFLAFVGAVSIFSNDVYISIFVIIWGISLTHLFYNKEQEKNQKIEVTNLKFDEEEIELDLKEEKEIQLIITPTEAKIEDLEYCSSDENIAVLISKNLDDKTLIVKPISEGTCELFVREKRKNRE